jgi:LytS/YehU family sensor histidine kinase
MEYIIISILLGVVFVLSFISYRIISQIQMYEENNQRIFIELNELADSISQVLSKEIYSNDRVIISFVEKLKDIEYYIKQIDPNLDFNELGEKNDG